MEQRKKWPGDGHRPAITVREMEIDDLPQVFHLGEKLFTASTVPNLYHTWDEHEIVQLFDSDREFCIVAETEEKIIGFALGTTVEKAKSAWKYGLLIWLGIDPTFQQHGVGRRLFLRFREIMEEDGVRIIIVETESDNISALKFFTKLGFGKPIPHVYLSLNLSAGRPQKKP